MSQYDKPAVPRYLRSPLDANTYVDATLPGVLVLLDSGWTLVERVLTAISCPGCGHTHSCDRYVPVAAEGQGAA